MIEKSVKSVTKGISVNSLNTSDPYVRVMINRVIAKHEIPVSNYVHPKGVIVPGDDFMTDKLKDPNYVPYCLVTIICGRVRKTDFGFECPTCYNKMNFDLTHYNGNIDIKYEKDSNERRK